MDLHAKTYPSKVLLFGEYTIIQGGSALSIPYNKHSGSWSKSSESDLTPFFIHLRSLSYMDHSKINKAIDENWVFNSDIPQGYGLGSSGALTAAAFDAFAVSQELSIDELKVSLAEIESFFHGQSSGLDPLTSYLKRAILFENGLCRSEVINLPKGLFYLYDSEMNRNTKSLVEYYKKKRGNDDGFEKITNQLSELNALAILSLQNSNHALLKDCLVNISQLQLLHFEKMIPEHIGEVWARGLATKEYYFKLSGAGGGGNFMVYGDVISLNAKHVSPLDF